MKTQTKTHTELLMELIDAVYATTATTNLELYKIVMKAAEIKGQMMATCETTTEPQPDADGWVENTGVKPDCKVGLIRMLRRGGENIEEPYAAHSWSLNQTLPITHYKPA